MQYKTNLQSALGANLHFGSHHQGIALYGTSLQICSYKHAQIKHVEKTYNLSPVQKRHKFDS